MDALAVDLGIEFKPSKDLGISTPLLQLEFLGIQLSTYPIVEAFPSTIKIAKLTTLIHQLLPTRFIPYKAFESLMGKLSFLAQFHSVLKLALFPLYHIMHRNNHTPHLTPPPTPIAVLAPHLYYILSLF